MKIGEFQDLMRKIYFDKDNHRGISRTFLWLIEEMGELAKEVRKGDKIRYQREFGDCFAWLASLANLLGINLERELAVYQKGCPKCEKIPCECTH